jgi:hypothetical protein
MRGYINWVGGALLFALIIIGISTCNKYKHNYDEQSALISAMQDTVKHFKNKDGEQVAQITLLEGSKENLLNVIGKTDKRLAKLLREGASSGTSFQQITKFDTVTTIKVDTVQGKLSFSDTTKNQWLNLTVTLKDDSLKKEIELRDSLTVAFKKIKQGFLKPKKSVVEVTSANPYVKVTGLRSFDIPQKKSNLKFWFGVGIGAGAGYLLFK